MAVIAGMTVQFVAFAEGEPQYTGEHVRAFNNASLVSHGSPKRQFTGTTRPYQASELTTLRAAIAYGADVACSGAEFGGAITCRVFLKGAPLDRARRRITDGAPIPEGFEVSLILEFQEV